MGSQQKRELARDERGRFLKKGGQKRCAPQKTRGWTKDRKDAFLAELAQRANVAAAARAVGMPEKSPYSLRRTDAKFRAEWEQALGEGYVRLEMLLLEHATYGKSSGLGAKTGISPALALQLLKARQARLRGPLTAPKRQPKMRGQKLREEIEAKLSEINRRLGGNG